MFRFVSCFLSLEKAWPARRAEKLPFNSSSWVAVFPLFIRVQTATSPAFIRFVCSTAPVMFACLTRVVVFSSYLKVSWEDFVTFFFPKFPTQPGDPLRSLSPPFSRAPERHFSWAFSFRVGDGLIFSILYKPGSCFYGFASFRHRKKRFQDAKDVFFF